MFPHCNGVHYNVLFHNKYIEFDIVNKGKTSLSDKR